MALSVNKRGNYYGGKKYLQHDKHKECSKQNCKIIKWTWKYNKRNGGFVFFFTGIENKQLRVRTPEKGHDKQANKLICVNTPVQPAISRLFN
jgi:hypothetical protein